MNISPNYSAFNLPLQAPNSPIVFEPTKEKTTPVLGGCVEMTKDSVSILNPKYSFVIAGISMMCEPASGGYLGDLNHGLGFLLLAASPIIETGRVALGLAGIVAGAISTAVMAPVALGEKTVRKISNANQLDDPALKRKGLLSAFIKRIGRLIKESKFSDVEKQELLDDPRVLIAISGLSLAFYSRGEIGSRLKMGDNQILEEIQIESLDDQFKSFFKGVNELKNTIYHMGGYRKTFSWNDLITGLDQSMESTATNGMEEQRYLSTYRELDKKAKELADQLFKDAGFQELWVVQKQQFINNNNNQ